MSCNRAADSSTSIAAPTYDGYTFLCWANPITSGWIASVYVEVPDHASTNVWVSSSKYTSGTGNIDLYPLYTKNV